MTVGKTIPLGILPRNITLQPGTKVSVEDLKGFRNHGASLPGVGDGNGDLSGAELSALRTQIEGFAATNPGDKEFQTMLAMVTELETAFAGETDGQLSDTDLHNHLLSKFAVRD